MEDDMTAIAPRTIRPLLATRGSEAVVSWVCDALEATVDPDETLVLERRHGDLVPAEQTDGGSEAAVPIETTIPGGVLIDGTGCVIADRQAISNDGDVQVSRSPAGSVAPTETYRSMICVPIGKRGVLVALGTEPHDFEDDERAIAETIAQLAETALDRVESEHSVHTEALAEIRRLVSHDLTTKLSIVRGRLELASRETDVAHLEEVDSALDGIESIARIVSTLARTGGPIDRTVAVSLADAAREAFGPLAPPEATLEVADGGTIEADPSCLGQLLENLLKNAVDHGEPPITITVGTHDDGFYVADDGSGIPADLRERVLDPGFSTHDRNDGKGLTIVEHLATAHGWTMTIDEAVSGGARIEFHDVAFVGANDC